MGQKAQSFGAGILFFFYMQQSSINTLVWLSNAVSYYVITASSRVIRTAGFSISVSVYVNSYHSNLTLLRTSQSHLDVISSLSCSTDCQT